MDKYAAGKIEGLLMAARKFLEFVAEELRVATSGAKKIELGVKIGHALADLIDISREIYAEHPKLNPFLEMEQATAEWRAIQRKISPKSADPYGGLEFVGGAWRRCKNSRKKKARTRR
jgi:hypothetical protein